jgi:hypothetical protein
MISPDNMIEGEVRRREALFNPLGPGTVHKAFRAVTHGADFPAGITPDTATDFLLKAIPSFFRSLSFEIPDNRMHLVERGFLHRIADQKIRLLWRSMGAAPA